MLRDASTAHQSSNKGGWAALEEAAALQAFFTLIYSYPMFYQELSNEVFRDLFINTRKNDAAFVEETYKLLVPEPHGPELQVGPFAQPGTR